MYECLSEIDCDRQLPRENTNRKQLEPSCRNLQDALYQASRLLRILPAAELTEKAHCRGVRYRSLGGRRSNCFRGQSALYRTWPLMTFDKMLTKAGAVVEIFPYSETVPDEELLRARPY